MTTPDQSAEAIYNFLVGALSEDGNIRRQAEEALRKAEEERDFFASLVQITTASNEEVPPNVRWLAALCGKNAVRRSWRRHSQMNAVTDDERNFVTSVLLDALGEDHSQIATQISVWIASIARHDFPRHRPDVLTDICQRVVIAENKKQVMRHALVTLDMSLKQLSSRRLLSDRIALQHAGPSIFSLLHKLFFSKLDELNSAPDNSPEQHLAFDMVVYCMKSIRRVLCYACANISELPNVEQIFVQIAHHRDLFMRGATGGTEIQLRLSQLAVKLVRKTHERHPVSFQPYLNAFLQLYYGTVMSFDVNVSDDDICFHSAAFLRNSLQCADYEINSSTMADFNQRQAAGLSHPTEVSAAGCRSIVLSFFTNQATDALIETFITKIFVLTSSELEQWANDPESLVRDEEAAEWGKENLRRECEYLFVMTLVRDKERIAPLIVKLALSAPKEKPLLLDACYRAIGRAAYDARGAFVFDEWLKGPLFSILEANCGGDLGERIIQARTVWLIGQFVEQLSRETRAAVYPLLVRLMSSTEYDRVIALTAAKTMQDLVDDLGFRCEDFLPHLETCVVSCFKLISCSEEFETKRSLLGTVSNLVTVCKPHVIAPVVEIIVVALPALWDDGSATGPTNSVSGTEVAGSLTSSLQPTRKFDDSTNDEEMVRTTIVTLLTCIIRRTGDLAFRTVAMWKVVMAILEFSIDTGEGKGGGFMLDDGCNLWIAVVDSSAEYNDDLRRLFAYVTKILDRDFDNLSQIFELIQSYALLGRESFMREFAPSVMGVLRGTMKSLRDRGQFAAVDVVDLILSAFAQDGVRACGDILKLVVDTVVAKTESAPVLAAYVGLIARAALIDIAALEGLVFARDEAIYVDILDRLVEHLGGMYRLPRRKVGALALCGLCARYSMSMEVRKRIPDVLKGVTQIFIEEKKVASKQEARMSKSDFENAVARDGEQASWNAFNGDDAAPPSKGHERRKMVLDSGVEHSVSLQNACSDLLMKLKGFSEQAYNEVLQATSPTVIQELQSFLQK